MGALAPPQRMSWDLRALWALPLGVGRAHADVNAQIPRIGAYNGGAKAPQQVEQRVEVANAAGPQKKYDALAGLTLEAGRIRPMKEAVYDKRECAEHVGPSIGKVINVLKDLPVLKHKAAQLPTYEGVRGQRENGC